LHINADLRGCDSITNPLFDFINPVQHSSTKKNKDTSEAAMLPQALPERLEGEA
jgi:hypothetical protein